MDDTYNDVPYDDYEYDDGEGNGETLITQGVNEYKHAYDETAIELANFGLSEIDPSNPHAMRIQRMKEGEEKFFLRQLIYAYKFLKYSEKLSIQQSDFYKVKQFLTTIPFPTKKSPLGILLAYYMYDPKNFIKQDRFNKIMGVKENDKPPTVSANTVVPLNYMYKVYASDLIRYVKLFHYGEQTSPSV